MNDIIVLVGLPIVRSVVGWADNALEDNMVSKLEWKKLIGTVVRVGTMGIVAYYGLNSAGIDISGLSAAAGAYIADIVFKKLG